MIDEFILDQDDREATKALNKLEAKYRHVFNAELGREVLADLLVNFCNFGGFLDANDKAQIGAYNVGISILSRMGIFSPNTDRAAVVNSLCNTPHKEE
jgi:hypothetical protein